MYSAHIQWYASNSFRNRNDGHGTLPGWCDTAQTSGTIQSEKIKRRTAMAQKVIDVVGTSKESFAKAAENAVAEAAKTVRGLKWARVAQLEMELDGQKIAQYRTTTKIYFDIEH
jgi:flavin-binding protein dodecin